ncbi:MAG: dockerin type I domain-containing protein [Gammaproteobacteria bacterium]
MRISKQLLSLLVLLCSSKSMAAATVSVTPSNATPNIGDTFYVTVSGAGFPEVAGAVLLLNFNSAVVSVKTPTLSNGIVLAPGSPFGGGIIADSPFLSGGQLVFLAPNPPLPMPAGSFDAIRVYFTVVGFGAANILLVQDGLDNAWTDANTFEPIPVTYTQAVVQVGGPAVAGDDGPVAATEGVAKSISVGTNDTGFTNPVSVTVTAQPTQGTITAVSAPGPAAGMTITYTANIGASGADSFTYEMVDSYAASDSATVNVSIGPDSDGDGLGNADDNCTLVANTATGNVPGTSPPIPKYQLDSDNDGFGNACDADLNNTGQVTAADYAMLRSVVLYLATETPLAAKADLNGSGQVTAADSAIMRARMNTVPGPSGLACAGTIPCP